MYTKIMQWLFGAQIKSMLDQAVGVVRADVARLTPLLIEAAGSTPEVVGAGFGRMAGEAVTTANTAEDSAVALLAQALEQAETAANARRKVDGVRDAASTFGFPPVAAQAGRARKNWGRVKLA